MFALYNNAKNVVVEDNFGHLIKMLEIDGSQCFKRRSKPFMKMAGLCNFNCRWCCLKFLLSYRLLLVN